MTDSFNGFSPEKNQIVPVHAQFFSEVLPLVDDLAEMKVVLFCYRALQQKTGTYRYLVREDFLEDDALCRGLAAAEDDVQAALQRGLARALEHGVLLAAEVEQDGEKQTFYFMNTHRGQAAVRQIAAGQFIPDASRRIEVLPERPSIYRLYEENIGHITPMIAEELKDAEEEYPYAWLQEAMKIAVESNKRSWKYIRAILVRWQQEGRHNETVERSGSPNGGFAGKQWGDYAE